MLRKFKISVDGKEYLVEMEEIGGTPVQQVPQTMPAPTAAAPVAPVVAEAAPAAAPVVAGAGEVIESPMPGTILKIAVKVGDVVTIDQPLLVLEAMKMENEIVAPVAGTVVGVHVGNNEAVDVGAPLITIQ